MKGVLRVAAAGLLTVLVIEAAIRLFVSYIPFELIRYFDADLRQKITFERDPLDGVNDRMITRDDGGPPLRIFAPGRRVTKGYGDEGTANSVVTDDQGFCNSSEHSYNRERIDIVAIGDSLTWCTSIRPEEAWPALLGTHTGKSVYNLGVPGVGAYEYLVLLRRFGVAKRPRVVVMAIYEGNDLRDALRYWQHRLKLNKGEESKNQTRVRTILNGSYAANLVAAVWAQATNARQPAWRDHEGPLMWRGKPVKRSDLNFRYQLHDGTRALRFNIHNSDRDELLHAIALDRGLIELDVFDGALLDFVELGRSECFIPFVTYIPSAYTAYDAFVRFEDAEAGPVLRHYSRRQRKYLAAAAKRLGFRFLDLTETLQEAAAGSFVGPENESLMYYPGTVHLGPNGNKIIANRLAGFLDDLLEEANAAGC